MASKNKTTIYVTGDLAIDHSYITGKRKFYSSDEEVGTTSVKRNGGVFLLFDLLSKIKDEEVTNIGDVHFGFDEKIFNRLPNKFNSYLKVSQFENNKIQQWKVDKMFGFGNLTGNYTYPEKYAIQKESDIVVIDDATMDFGSSANQNVWPAFVNNKSSNIIEHPKLIVYKITGRVGKGELLKKVVEQHSDRLITIVSISDLRRQFLKVSKGISWEQTALDLVNELNNNKSLDTDLLQGRFLIVTFQTGGAVLIERISENEYVYQLIFDPKNMDDEWESKLNGEIIGRLACFTATFTAKLNLSKPDKNFEIEEAIKAGLTAVRMFHSTGYLPDIKGEMNVPFKEIASVLNQEAPYKYSKAFIPNPKNTVQYLNLNWSVLMDNFNNTETITPLYNIARRVAKYGENELANVPHANFGKLFSADRNEIENFRNVKNIMDNYVKHDKGKKPLSIGIFGPPGSGKSFSVEQIATAVLEKDVSFFEFNLSQFAGPEDLIGAFHQIRDVVLLKKVPIVFWDEFDSKNFDWLQYLLAPMQDGKFQEGQISHPIGKSIFIFAGGTSYTMENFGPVEPLNPNKHQKELTKAEKEIYTFENYQKLFKQYEEDVVNFKLKKGPDFKSRLNAFLNVLGPNKSENFDRLRWKWLNDETDVFFPIRRALFVRALLKIFGDKELKMEWGLINAFMKTEKYVHGARSLGQIIDQLNVNNSNEIISRSCLPSNEVLSMHVKRDDFFDILTENTKFLRDAYIIAPDIHGVWMSTAKTRHHEYIKDFQFLPIFTKESNYAAAKRIPQVLAEVGLIVVSEDNPSKINTKADYLKVLKKNGKGKNKSKKLLEIMAEKEHEMWMKFHFKNGWEYNKVRNDSKKQHNSLIEYNKLKKDDKDKDREQVEMYFDFLTTAGFGIAVE